MPRLFKKLNQSAQHLIEYALILVLVMAGVIVMGPYAIRSWNAQMKGWEDSVIDSLNDPMQVKTTEILPGCVCTWVEDPTCGTGPGCSNPRQRYALNVCDPDGCELSIVPRPPEDRCVWDISCCTDWSPDSSNPTVPDPNPNTDCGPNASPPCPIGEARQTRQCGEDVTETQCSPDPNCPYMCLGTKITYSPTTPEYGEVCSPAEEEENPETPQYYTYVNAGGCTPDRACEIECAPGYFSQGGRFCSLCLDVGVPQGSCPAGQYDRQGCPEGQYIPCCVCPTTKCQQGSCGPGKCEIIC